MPGTSKITTAVRSLCVVFFLAEYEHTPVSSFSHYQEDPTYGSQYQEDPTYGIQSYFLSNSIETLKTVIQGARISIQVAFLHHVHKPRPHTKR